MKILDKFVIIVFNICLVIVSIWISAIPISKSKSYYQNQFRKNNIYATTLEDGTIEQTPFYYVGGQYSGITYFTDEELDIMIDHIINYLYGDKITKEDTESDFSLQIDGREIFGSTAVEHMSDVKNLFITWQILSIIALIVMIGLFAYICLRINQMKKDLLRFTLIFYGIVLLCFGAFFIWAYVTTTNNGQVVNLETFGDNAFRNLHYLFFPFQPEKVAKSFFNDTLTEILTIELFQTAIIIVMIVLFTLQILWLIFTIIIRKYGDRIGNKIKENRYTGPTLKQS